MEKEKKERDAWRKDSGGKREAKSHGETWRIWDGGAEGNMEGVEWRNAEGGREFVPVIHLHKPAGKSTYATTLLMAFTACIYITCVSLSFSPFLYFCRLFHSLFFVLLILLCLYYFLSFRLCVCLSFSLALYQVYLILISYLFIQYHYIFYHQNHYLFGKYYLYIFFLDHIWR